MTNVIQLRLDRDEARTRTRGCLAAAKYKRMSGQDREIAREMARNYACIALRLEQFIEKLKNLPPYEG